MTDQGFSQSLPTTGPTQFNSPGLRFTITFGFTNTQTLQLLVAQEAVKNLWQMHKYSNLYLEYVTGSLSEEDFSREAEAFARLPLNQIPAEQILFCVNYLRHLIPDLSPAVVADILRIEDSILDSVLAGAVK